jgi:ComF family protein
MPLHQFAASARRALDLVLPPQALDGGDRPQTVGLSAEAWSRIAFIEGPMCDGCGLPFEYDLGEGVRCPACLGQPRAFARARHACLYDDNSRDLILKLKHADRPELAALFALWLSRAAADLIADAEVVAPVPLHPLRLFWRRYNQAAEIARPLARRWAIDFAPDVLQRHRDTKSQGGKSGRGRRLNVRGAFVVPPAARPRIAGKRVLLVDDVFTTGATAEACAQTLLAAGAAGVDVACVARVREAGDRPI